jgi:2-oxoisovalerate dehydrogenase E1 component
LPVPADAIVVCSFGDASLNHSTATGAINAAAYAAHQSLPVPVLFVCEDNGIGISVNTAPGWIEATFGKRDGITYFSADGLDLVNTYEVTQEAVDYCRKQRQPTFLHLKVIRLLGHAGTDFEAGYRSLEEIAALEAEDPVRPPRRRFSRSTRASVNARGRRPIGRSRGRGSTRPRR